LKQAVETHFTPPSIEDKESETDHDILQKHLEKLGQEPKDEENQDQEEKSREELKVQEAKAKTRLDKIKEQERELLDTRSQPIRQYLMDNVVPLLTEGLIKICKEMPDKPTGTLADYLIQRCDEIEAEEKEEEVLP